MARTHDVSDGSPDSFPDTSYHAAAQLFAAGPLFDPHEVHAALMERAERRVRFRPDGDVALWRREIGEALATVIGEMPRHVDLDPQWDEPVEVTARDGTALHTRRVTFAVEEGARGVGWFVTAEAPSAAPPARRPTMICLQGHSSGAHISLGQSRFPGDEKDLDDDHDYAVQAVQHGYNAFVLEQRGFGERMDSRPPRLRGHYDYRNPFTDERCRHQAMTALLIGRTFVGERVHDVRRAVDLLENLPHVDPSRIGCMGNSGGGTVTYYAACLEPRIAAAMPGCSVCTYASSIGSVDHCSDNYLPGALKYFDMGDLAGLIAPRPLIVVAGDEDPIFPYAGVTESFRSIEEVYATIASPGIASPGDARCALYTGHGGHRFYRDAWERFAAVTGWG